MVGLRMESVGNMEMCCSEYAKIGMGDVGKKGMCWYEWEDDAMAGWSMGGVRKMRDFFVIWGGVGKIGRCW